MSEKRFVKDHSYLINYDKYCILDKVKHKHLYLDEVCEKLNELNDENKELKKENKRLAKNLKVAKNNVDANFKSAQYWRQKFEAIPKSYTCTSGDGGQNE